MCGGFRLVSDFYGRASQRSVISRRSGRTATRSTLLIAISAALLIGAASAQTETKPISKSHAVTGFLGDYSRLSQAQDNGDLLIYVKQKGILKNYDKFIVDEVTVQLLPQAKERNLDPEDLKRLARDFRKALIDELQKSGRYAIVTDPGPRVLHLRAALTDVEPARNKANTAVTAGAVAASAAMAPGAALVAPRLSVGRASIEAEMLDSQSGERTVAVVTSKQGRRFFSGLRGIKKWGDVEAAFKQWAKAFRERLDQAHGAA
jgi:hypothetical protein